MNWFYRPSLFLIIFLVFSLKPVSANSSYVLPYPSAMPGGFNYKFHLLFEQIQKYWYFGNFGQFEYNLKESDKYLVEAKTLFEYNQFLLGHKALKKSDLYFSNTLPNLVKAKKENKNIDSKRKILKEASLKHIEVLRKIRQEIPETFLWQPEKTQSLNLQLRKDIENSIKIRNKYL